jgi:hypothetical protein
MADSTVVPFYFSFKMVGAASFGHWLKPIDCGKNDSPPNETGHVGSKKTLLRTRSMSGNKPILTASLRL